MRFPNQCRIPHAYSAIGVNLVPDFLRVGASFARDIGRRVASKTRSYRMSEVPNSKRAFGNEFATTNACLLKLTPMMRFLTASIGTELRVWYCLTPFYIIDTPPICWYNINTSNLQTFLYNLLEATIRYGRR